MTEKPLAPEFEEPELFDGDPDEAIDAEQEPIDLDELHQRFLQENEALVQQVLGPVGPAGILPLKFDLLDIRVGIVQDLVFRAVGDDMRVPFALEYENRVNQYLKARIEERLKPQLIVPS